MRYARSFLGPRCDSPKCVAVAVVMFVAVCSCSAQEKPQTPSFQKAPDEEWVQHLNNYPGLVDELIRLVDKLQHNVQYPAARNESRILPLLPDSVGYAAISNYGDAVHQSLAIFNDELRQSEPLRNWWQQSEVAAFGPKIEDSLEKLSQLLQYLGPEIVLSAAMDGKTPHLAIVAQAAKPGLRDFLEQNAGELNGNDARSKPPLRILEPQDLVTPPAAEPHGAPATRSPVPPRQFFALIRPDYVVASSDVATLKGFNFRIEQKGSEFASTSFGQRVARAYSGGVTIVGAADVHKILAHMPQNTKQSQLEFQNSGLADMKYFLWERRSAAGEAVSQMELSFTGPRHGAAAWLGKAAPMGTLDFASPKAMMVGAAILTSPAQIFDDLRSLGGESNAKAFAALGVFEQAFKVSLKEDFLSQLTGEFMLEMVDSAPPKPVWRTVFGVKDAHHVQQAFHTLITAMQIPATHSEVGEVTFYTVQMPSTTTAVKSAEPAKPSEVTYAFADGYLIVGSSQDAVAEGIQLHKTGESLAKSHRFLEALPPGQESRASALFYQDSVATSVLRLQSLAPEYAAQLAKLTGQSKAQVFCLYGEEMAIRGASRSSGFDAGAIMIAGAIAIPNLLRARTAANEASAVGTMRTVNAAQLTYKTTYPQRGYAPDLATLGPTPKAEKASADHANLIDNTLGNATCNGVVSCTKFGYRFSIKAECMKQACDQFVILGTPVTDNTGTRSYCSTSDGIIRFKLGSPITQSLSATECRKWSPLN